MPPTPINAEISNEPRRVPGVSATECRDYMRDRLSAFAVQAT
jgi:hypothetical protein